MVTGGARGPLRVGPTPPAWKQVVVPLPFGVAGEPRSCSVIQGQASNLLVHAHEDHKRWRCPLHPRMNNRVASSTSGSSRIVSKVVLSMYYGHIAAAHHQRSGLCRAPLAVISVTGAHALDGGVQGADVAAMQAHRSRRAGWGATRGCNKCAQRSRRKSGGEAKVPRYRLHVGSSIVWSRCRELPTRGRGGTLHPCEES
jgi:hypothetical protein